MAQPDTIAASASNKQPHQGQLDAEAAVLAAFGAYLVYMTKATQTTEFLRLVDTGLYQQAMEVINQAVAETLAPAVTSVAIKAGSAEVSSFDPTQAPLLAFERKSFIQRFTEDAALAMLAGLMARRVATFGLTYAQEQAAQSYRSLLETGAKQALNTVYRDRRGDAAITTGRPLTLEQINRMAETYRRRLIVARGETLANWEGGHAWDIGRVEAVKQAGAQYEGEWNTVGDHRVRPSHVAMDGQVQPFGASYISGNGNMLKYPRDPSAPISDTINCRCWIEYRRKGFMAW